MYKRETQAEHAQKPLASKHVSRRTKSVLSSLSPTFTFEDKPKYLHLSFICFNFSEVESDENTIIEALNQRYGNETHSIRNSKKPGIYELEIKETVDLNKMSLDDFIYKGHQIPRILATRPNENIFLVMLKNTPAMEERKLASVLEFQLLKFGHLIDLRLAYDKEIDCLDGDAYAFYDLEKSPNIKEKLPQTLELSEAKDTETSLFWDKLPTIASLDLYNEMDTMLNDTKRVRQALETWWASTASKRLMDARTEEQFEKQHLQHAISIPYNQLNMRWFELPSRQASFALLLPMQEKDLDERESVLGQLRVRGWDPLVILWDEPSLWQIATAMGLLAKPAGTEPIRFLFSPSPFLEEQIPGIEMLLIESAMLRLAESGSNNDTCTPTQFKFRLCDVGCGSGRDVAWMLARSRDNYTYIGDAANVHAPLFTQFHMQKYNFCWSACAIDAWQGAVTRTCQLLMSRQFTTTRAQVVRAQFQPDGCIRYYNAPSTNQDTSNTAALEYRIIDQHVAQKVVENTTYDLVVAVRFLERAAFSHLNNCVAPGGFLLYSTFVDGISEYEQPAGQAHRLTIGELAGYFNVSRGYTILEDRIDWTEDGRPLNSFLARQLS
ncbi:hypothetical protein BDF19DRAFT_431210 [Syncephalis fuscata]|nr:hypothetical protein BDF19DRAFT_431210 [Syncephalis fuscata]